MINAPTSETRLGDLASADPKAVERLAAFHPVFALHHDRAIADASLGELAERTGLPVVAVLAVAEGEIHAERGQCRCGCEGERPA